ncbi:MAG: ChaN family lipoprotein [Bacteroidota bacterium]
MTKRYLLIPLSALIFMSFTIDKPAYTLFDQEGKQVKYSKMLREMQDADIIFFGELHTDPIAHWLQLEMTRALYDQKKEGLILGAEMFEADNQLILDEYLNGIHQTDKFEAEIRLWGNYQTDYKPLVEFAREHHIPFIATNIPRRYASIVHYKGFEGLEELSDEARRYMAPLPMNYDPEVKCYKEMISMMEMPAMPSDEAKSTPEKGTSMPAGEPAMHGARNGASTMENLPKAQALKDATMAYFILKNWSEGKTMFHFNGEYHSRNFEGIVWHLKQQNPDLKIVTISTVSQKEIELPDEENRGIASYVLCVPENMTKTNR